MLQITQKETPECRPHPGIAMEGFNMLTTDSDSNIESQNCQERKPTTDMYDFLKTFLDPEPSKDHLPEEEPHFECMSIWHSEPRPETGERIKYPWYCHDFRNCPICHVRRQDELKDRLIYAQSHGIKVAVIPLNDPRIASMVRKLPTKAYFKLPAEQDCDGALFFDADQYEGAGEEIGRMADSDKLPYGLDWYNLTNTPKGSRISGKLGLPEENEEKEDREGNPDFVKITVVSVVTRDHDQAKTQWAWDEAVSKTRYLDPHTAEEAEDAIAILMSAYKDALREKGIEVVNTVRRDRWLQLSLLHWNRGYNKLNDMKPLRNSTLEEKSTVQIQKIT